MFKLLIDELKKVRWFIVIPLGIVLSIPYSFFIVLAYICVIILRKYKRRGF